MARILPLFIMAGVIGVALTILVTLIMTQEAAAQTEQGSLACVDSNNNKKDRQSRSDQRDPPILQR